MTLGFFDVGFIGSLNKITFDVSKAVFLQLRNVGAQDITVRGMTWNNDGSKMYVIGSANDSVYEYDLTTNYDISTAVFLQSKNVSAQDTIPTGLAWNNDGSKMYITGSVNDSVFEYDLTINYDISTATFSQSKNVSAQDLFPIDIDWNNDGSKMYINGNGNSSVFEYDLTINYDISTATFSQSKNVSAQDTAVNGLAWNNDGSKMYIIGAVNDSVFEYDLTINYDISTAVFLQSKNVSAQDTSPIDIAWNNDGSKMYILGGVNNVVYEYDVS